jgi:hypothetical protein
MLVFPGLAASCLINAFNSAFRSATGARADQHQANYTWGIHQFRVRIKDDPTIYRVIVAPEDAPLFVGSATEGLSIDKHFLESMLDGAADQPLTGAPDGESQADT